MVILYLFFRFIDYFILNMDNYFNHTQIILLLDILPPYILLVIIFELNFIIFITIFKYLSFILKIIILILNIIKH